MAELMSVGCYEDWFDEIVWISFGNVLQQIETTNEKTAYEQYLKYLAAQKCAVI